MYYDPSHKMDTAPMADIYHPTLTRPYLDAETGELIATDCHGIVAIPVKLEAWDKTGPIPKEALRDASKATIVKNNGGTVKIDCTDEDFVVVRNPGNGTETQYWRYPVQRGFEKQGKINPNTVPRDKGYTFPDWKRCVKDYPDRSIVLGLDAKKLLDIALALDKDRKGQVSIVLDLDEIEKAVDNGKSYDAGFRIMATSAMSRERGNTAMLMPVRVYDPAPKPQKTEKVA